MSSSGSHVRGPALQFESEMFSPTMLWLVSVDWIEVAQRVTRLTVVQDIAGSFSPFLIASHSCNDLSLFHSHCGMTNAHLLVNLVTETTGSGTYIYM